MGLPCATSHEYFHALAGPFPEAALPHRPADVLVPVRWGQQLRGFSACSPVPRIFNLGHLPFVTGAGVLNLSIGLMVASCHPSYTPAD